MNFKTHLKFFPSHTCCYEPYCFWNYFINACSSLLFFSETEDFNLLSCLGTSSSFILTRARIEMFVGGTLAAQKLSHDDVTNWRKKGMIMGARANTISRLMSIKSHLLCSWSHFYYGYLSMDHHKIVCLALILLSREKISRSQCQ